MWTVTNNPYLRLFLVQVIEIVYTKCYNAVRFETYQGSRKVAESTKYLLYQIKRVWQLYVLKNERALFMAADMRENSAEITKIQDVDNSNNKQFPTWKCVTDYFSYITPAIKPLSANVSVIEGEKYLWVYDVGSHENIPEMLAEISKQKGKKIKIILSHFHPDHIANVQHIKWESLYQGKNTYKYTHIGEIVESDINVDETDIKLRIFQMPSSHAKGSLALLVNNKYCLLGDALYPAHKGDKTVYNAGILKQQIDILKKMAAPYVLLSHREPFVQKKQAVISWLEKIYAMREKNEPWILMTGQNVPN